MCENVKNFDYVDATNWWRYELEKLTFHQSGSLESMAMTFSP